jgi:hypothetical protein
MLYFASGKLSIIKAVKYSRKGLVPGIRSIKFMLILTRSLVDELIMR